VAATGCRARSQALARCLGLPFQPSRKFISGRCPFNLIIGSFHRFPDRNRIRGGKNIGSVKIFGGRVVGERRQKKKKKKKSVKCHSRETLSTYSCICNYNNTLGLEVKETETSQCFTVFTDAIILYSGSLEALIPPPSFILTMQSVVSLFRLRPQRSSKQIPYMCNPYIPFLRSWEPARVSSRSFKLILVPARIRLGEAG
jgi:hypothetical protein